MKKKRKFTPEELIDAQEQIAEEQMHTNFKIQEAASWLKKELKMTRCNCLARPSFGPIWPGVLPVLVLVYETYGPDISEYKDILDKMPCVTKDANSNYQVDTPYGKFRIDFEYFNNHCLGC